MIQGMLAKKLGMTQVYDEAGRVIPVTVLEVGPCVVTQVKSADQDGYNAVQLGLVEKKAPKSLSKGELGHLKKNGLAPMRHLREFNVSDNAEVSVGQEILVTNFAPKEKVSVTGTSQGKGFQGVVKRHGYRGGRMTHGSDFHRAPGSIGQCSFPSRVFPGKGMPGHMGSKKITVKNLEVVQVIEDKNLLLVKGAVPGCNGSLVSVVKA